jgi:hypothetical protein
LRKIRVGGLDDEVIVVAHEAVSMADPIVTEENGRNDIQECLTVRVVEEDRLSCIAAGGNVIDREGKFKWRGRAMMAELVAANLIFQDLALRVLPVCICVPPPC